MIVLVVQVIRCESQLPGSGYDEHYHLQCWKVVLESGLGEIQSVTVECLICLLVCILNCPL